MITLEYFLEALFLKGCWPNVLSREIHVENVRLCTSERNRDIYSERGGKKSGSCTSIKPILSKITIGKTGTNNNNKMSRKQLYFDTRQHGSSIFVISKFCLKL